VDDWELRHRIYREFLVSGRAPERDAIASWVGGADEAVSALRRLQDAHLVVLDEGGRIRMALPFSAVPTAHSVSTAAITYSANCAWDTFGIAGLLDADVTISSDWADNGARFELTIRGGRLSDGSGFVHFPLPARSWWDDIVDT
jgi:hypothetical protein